MRLSLSLVNRYSIEARDEIYVKRCEFLSLAKNAGKNVSKTLNGKFSQKLLDGAKKSSSNVLKTVLKRAIQKTVEATGNLIINNIAERLIECVTRTIHEIPQASQKRQ